MKVQPDLCRRWIVPLVMTLTVVLSPVSSVAEGLVAMGSPDAVSRFETGSTTEPLAQPADPAISDDWWAAAQEHIRASEYHATWQETTYLEDVAAAYQAPNRAQNLRTYFAPEGPVVIPRTWPEGTAVPPWRLQLRLAAWGREGALQPLSRAALEVEDNRIEYFRGDLVEGYRNDERGLEQVFNLMSPPDGRQSGTPLQLELVLGGDLIPEMIQDASKVEFRTLAGDAVLRYGGLQAADATGKMLPSSLVLEGSTLSILVEDAEAVYPIEVDPAITGLPPDHQWSITFGQAGARFGKSVATAGDVNGDGYSEVIVGVPAYDAGVGWEGAVFVYYGSPTGLVTAPGWFKVFDQVLAKFGQSVATAGDVNGDGYADVIVGAPSYENGQSHEGGIWVYYGSSGGLQHDGYDHKEGNLDGALFGSSVATAGDVNGEEDGRYYSDVIVGAPGYTFTQENEGRVYVWHGSEDGLGTGHDWYAETNQVNTQLGYSVGTAGDVNGDGYSDVIVGAAGYDPWTPYDGLKGAAFVWHGSASGVNGGDPGTLDNYDWMNDGYMDNQQMGFSVSTAGDVNGDGYSDVIVGAPCPGPGSPCYSSINPWNAGRVYLYPGSAAGLEDTVIKADFGEHAGANFGWAVSAAGDVDGDGYADVIVGSPDFTDDELWEGRAYVWYGEADPPSIAGLSDWHDDGAQVEAHYGRSVATAGDVNGDGYSDIIVGAPGWASDPGRAYVYHGGPDTLSETVGKTKYSNQSDALFGTSVGTAGDVNGDGYADVIVGAPRWDGGFLDEGGVWVYEGSRTGLVGAPLWHKVPDQPYAEFGTSVGTAGDVNGDGYDDVIVGAPYWTDGKDDEGGAWVYRGSSSGMVNKPLWYKTSDQEGAEFGTSVGTAGDVNGDGYSDVIVGARFYDHGSEDEGMAWVYHGTDTAPHLAPDWDGECDREDAEYGRAVGTAGDVNGDGYSDIIVGAPMWDEGAPANEGRAWVYHGSPGGVRETYSWRQRGTYFNAQYGYAVGTAGDVNGDCFSDIIVGAPNWWDDRENEGKVWVYHGSGVGPDSTSSWSKEGGQNGAHYGWSVGTAGDVNGDGYADIIIGIEGWDGGVGLGNEGRASAYHGSYGGLEDAKAWSAESGQGTAHYGYSVGTAGDVNGDGYADVIVGAPTYQRTTELRDEGHAFLYYGNGGPGVALRPVQRKGDNSPLAHLGISDRHDGSMVRMLRKNPFGLGGMDVEIEGKPLGVAFDGSDTWGDWPTYTRREYGNDTYRTWSGLMPGMPYHWRIRWRYDPVTTPWMPASRWVTMPWNGWNEADFRTAGDRAMLPVVLRAHSP